MHPLVEKGSGPREVFRGRSVVRAARLALLAAAACLVLAPPASASDEPVPESVEGVHYRLSWQGPRSEAEAFAKCLEAAWEPFKAFFGAAPKLREGERLSVRYYPTAAAWAEGLRADGSWVPEGAGGYYNPTNQAVYFFRQPTRYYTRSLMLHEACHQFHFLSRTGNRSVPAGWYVEGIVEHLALHRWDGEKLELGEQALSLEDYPARALDALKKGECELRGLVDGKGNRPAGAMLVRFLIHGENGRFRRAYEAMAASLDHGQEPGPCWRSLLGDPKALQPRFVAWLESAQCPWTPVFNEWEQTAADRFLGFAPGVTSACRLKAPARRLEAKVEVPESGPWAGGLLLHLDDLQHFTTALADSSGNVVVARFHAGVWTVLRSAPLPPPAAPGLLAFAAERADGKVSLAVEGKPVGTFELPGSVLGLALRDGELRFRDVAWEPAGK